ncbi:MaoC/PaaZ C-terminal domain-containing protein [Euzebya tangerina]|uniref:MaoC/PaaZ C-terminal domain-containing protein n=1 Tax=Euzebya tangerina TaxID=591198 RepID=UPI000E31C884|nr:MaoC/PaaZ C-terminal domain-containing protein [Euzebya tangerina]
MPIDIETLLAAPPIEWDSSWTQRDVMLYHLGIGAGVPATDPRELRYVYEEDLVVLPTFGTIPGFMPIDRFDQLPGFDIDLRMLVHADHTLQLHGSLPTSATAVSRCQPSAVYDKRSGAMAVFEITTEVDGEVLITNTMSAFIKGEGDFGGDGGPRPERVRAPKRDADAVVHAPTLEQQALLYRLSGDYNPLHVDPEFAAVGGFDRPILHGMCTFGSAGKAAVDTVLDGDGSAVRSFSARFSGVVMPGDTLVHSLWREGDEVIVESAVNGSTVLKQAKLTLT